MSSNIDDYWFDRAASLWPYITGGEAKQLNEYAKIHDGETFAMYVSSLERKYLSVADVEALSGVTDEELDIILAERIKRDTRALEASDVY